MSSAFGVDPRDYYRHLTDLYVQYGSGWHHGIWEPGIRSHRASLQRANEVTVGGLTINEETRLLDVGFGCGGFAVWAASTFGCSVTAITICPEHVPLAEQRAKEAGVAERCRFLVMDMDDLTFEDGLFDVVVNQESLCHSDNKGKYLAHVWRLLKPGGYWRGYAFALRDYNLTPREKRRFDDVREGFHIPSLLCTEDVLHHLTMIGYEVDPLVDYTKRVAHSARLIRNVAWCARLLTKLGIESLVYSKEPDRRAAQRGHARACVAYGHGLLTGLFEHVLYSARRPAKRA